jgi:hypothetical protein
VPGEPRGKRPAFLAPRAPAGHARHEHQGCVFTVWFSASAGPW